jgi:3-oxoacyl-[acyl-carrier protein] reductase
MAPDQKPLAGKVAVITGAGSGVGRATAVALSSQDAVVGLIGRRRSALDETALIVQEGGGSALVLPADITQEQEVQHAINDVLTAVGGIDVLICAAGIGLYGTVENYALDDWQTTLATNLGGVFLACRAVLPAMKSRGGGAIIAIGSGAGKQGYANLAAYSASKFGLIGFMESLAAEVGEHGIKVSTVIPGSILTDFGGRLAPEKERQRAEGRKYLDAADVAQAIAYLLAQSDRAWTQELNLWPF